jgi:hypothetical protein
MNKLNKFLYLILVLFFVLGIRVANADVIINEVAWMGTSESASNEWIELYNNGTNSVNLSGWFVKTGDGNISIALSGSIAPSGFYLIERTDDTTVPSVVADLIASFGHGISNSGETLILKNNSGSDVETLSFESGWPAGDNTSKQTMQRLGSSWVTALATPRTATASASTNDDTASDDKNTEEEKPSDSGSSSINKKQIPPPKITAEILTQSMATIGVDLKINSSIKYGKETLMVGKLLWNFGDGSTLVQTKVEPIFHRYMYTGDYVLTLSYMEHDYQMTGFDATDRVIVSVVAPGVVISSIGNNSDPYVELENNSKSEIDLSLWKIKSEEAIFIIPSGTIILPGKKLTFSADVTHFASNSSVSLLRPSGQVTSVFPREVVRNSSRSTISKNQNSNSVNLSLKNSTIDLSKEDLTAEASRSGVSIPIGVIGAIILAIIGITATILFTRKSNDLDSPLLNSEDIKIIE